MTSHVHMIVGSRKRALDKTIGEMKSFTSRMLRTAIRSNPIESRKSWMIKMMNETGTMNSNNIDWQLWQQDNRPITLFSTEMFYQKLEYIHENPVKAGFVERMEDYTYSSAIDFFGGRGLIELDHIN